MKCSSKELAFLSTGYTDWKDAMGDFRKHEQSKCNKDAEDSLPKTTPNVADMLSVLHVKNKADNGKILLKII